MKEITQMQQAQIEQEVKRIMVELLLVDENELTGGALLDSDLGLDSLDRAEIVMALEEGLLYGVEIDKDTADNWQNVKDVLDTVTALAGAGK